MAISLALHVLLLWPDYPATHRRQPADLVVRLAAQEPVAAAPARRQPRDVQRRAATEVPPTLPAVAGEADIAVAPAAVRPPGGDGGTAEGMRQYRFGLALAARPFKPEAAPALAGTAAVRVAVGAAGSVDAVMLVASSGHGALDAAALDMMKGAAGQAAVPEVLRGRAFNVDLPVVFSPAED